jgi:general stress protein 26
MTGPAELEAKFWKALKSDRTMMLGIAGVEEGHTRPMTAQLEADEGGPIWFFTAKDNELVRHLRGDDRAVATFAAKDHALFAAVHGRLSVDTDRDVIDRLWNRFVAAWYAGGKDDPKLALLRLDPDQGQVWADASSFMAGVKMLLGFDPKKDYENKVAKVDLSSAPKRHAG